MEITTILPTPAGKSRKKRHIIDTIIVHAMAELIDYKGERFFAPDFLNKIGLSCHYMVGPTGQIVECANPKHRTTWHASGFNTHSIGIEILVPEVFNYTDFINRIDEPWVSDEQMNSVCLLVEQCFNEYPIDNLLRHCDVSPERKKDPGKGFDWEHLTSWIQTADLKDW